MTHSDRKVAEHIKNKDLSVGEIELLLKFHRRYYRSWIFRKIISRVRKIKEQS